MQLPIEQANRQKAYMAKVRDAVLQRTSSPLAYIDTYGCQQNESDSERLRGMLEEMGYGFTSDEFAADVIIINTCAIRENAENRVFGNVGALVHTKKAKPSQLIFFCGCMAPIAEVAEKIKQSYKHVDVMFSPNNLWLFPQLLYDVLLSSGAIGNMDNISPLAMSNDAIIDDALLVGESDTECSVSYESTPNEVGEGYIVEGFPIHRDRPIKAWLPIMYGCNNFCSYCIVPYVRGRERSRRSEDILAEAKELVANGYKDITLLGQNVNSYGVGLDEDINFADIIRQINDIEGDFFIRFMTSHPKDASEELFQAMAESEKAAKHIHLPFQSGNNRVLELMNRGYSHEEYMDKISLARKLMPDIVITSDVIVGFPGETDEEFEDTLRLIEQAQFDAMFTFIYSKRPGTPAASMPDSVTREEKQIRFDRLIELQNTISETKHSAYIGKTLKVLVDEESHDERYPLKARTNGGRLVHLHGDTDILGSYVAAKITHSTSWALFGEVGSYVK
ncbi:MAG: MiaB/RimO family radical SAM methylthiotransferase [Oscillospiraceae bacterium]|nr:MiaB/RimO family radical SAM methylthiotransferase [Oscillospiraceae bacterium]